MGTLIRINKLLSQAGIASRRKADELIEQGRVELNGKTLVSPGAMIDTSKDKVSVDGKEIAFSSEREHSYYLLNKPAGYVSTISDTHERRTIMQLVPKKKGLFPVGRLDKDTTGLILITNDGELAHRLMHPRYEIEKIYEVKINAILSNEDIEKLEKGIDIGEKTPAVSEIVSIKKSGRFSMLTLKIHEGRKRQIRRVFEALGCKVLSLERINYAGLSINMKLGSYRELTMQEISKLYKYTNKVEP